MASTHPCVRVGLVAGGVDYGQVDLLTLETVALAPDRPVAWFAHFVEFVYTRRDGGLCRTTATLSPEEHRDLLDAIENAG
ncbi:MAG: hypothetical protein AAF532_03625 [Planctomycetota bacterium]